MCNILYINRTFIHLCGNILVRRDYSHKYERRIFMSEQVQRSTLDKLFKITERGSSVSRELFAGATTFLCVSYVLAVNPAILGAAGMDVGAVFTATAVSAIIMTLLLALYSNMPFAGLSGMGINAFFAYTIVV